MKNYKYLQFLTALFVTLLLTSNLLSSAKIIDTGFNLFELPLIFDAGLLVFPLCYIFGDVLTEVYGYRVSRKVIWSGFFGNLLFILFIKLALVLPGETSWQEYAGDNAYEAILGGLATGGIILASLCAYLFGEFVNSFVVAKMKVINKGKYFPGRAILSTVAGQFFDTVIFFSITFAFGIFPAEIIFELIYTNYIFKVLIEVVLLPLTCMIVSHLKKVEKEDYYDTDTNFNPFLVNG